MLPSSQCLLSYGPRRARWAAHAGLQMAPLAPASQKPAVPPVPCETGEGAACGADKDVQRFSRDKGQRTTAHHSPVHPVKADKRSGFLPAPCGFPRGEKIKS